MTIAIRFLRLLLVTSILTLHGTRWLELCHMMTLEEIITQSTT